MLHPEKLKTPISQTSHQARVTSKHWRAFVVQYLSTCRLILSRLLRSIGENSPLPHLFNNVNDLGRVLEQSLTKFAVFNSLAVGFRPKA